MQVRGSYECPPASGSPETGDSLSDEHSELEPPDPISNSEVKRLSADGSVGSPHVRVGHRQALYDKRLNALHWGVFFCSQIRGKYQHPQRERVTP